MKLCARTMFMMTVAVSMLPALLVHAQGAADTSKAEVFLGYSRFGGGSTQTSANRMVGLNGGSAAFAFYLNRYVGLVADVGGYDANQLQLTGTGVNQPLVVNASGTAYTYLFGPRLSFRRGSRISPFAQVLVGGAHAGQVTVSNCAGAACTALPSQNALAMTAGGGLDFRVTRHISIRAVQAEYMLTRFASTTAAANTTQNDYRLSSGLVFRFGGVPPPSPMQLTCAVQPQSAFPGDPLTVAATATNLDLKRPSTYNWKTNGGTVSGSDANATINTTGVAPGSYSVSGSVTQGNRATQQAQCTASFTIKSPEPPTISCSASPDTVQSGGSSTVTAQGASPQNRALTFSYSATAGQIASSTSTATLSTAGVDPGAITVTCNVVDDLGKSASANTSVTVMAPPAAVVVAPQTRDLCSLSFERDRKRPVRVDNEAKACLDDIAGELQRESTGRLVIVGDYSPDEKPDAGTERATNARQYLTNEKGIDSQRIELRAGTASGRTATDVFVPAGATFK
jgi:opacity protein-like surface antigen